MGTVHWHLDADDWNHWSEIGTAIWADERYVALEAEAEAEDLFLQGGHDTIIPPSALSDLAGSSVQEDRRAEALRAVGGEYQIGGGAYRGGPRVAQQGAELAEVLAGAKTRQ